MAGLSKLLEFRGILREASELLDQARALIAAMLITDDYQYLHDVKVTVSKASKYIEEAIELARKMEEEVDIPDEFEEVEEL